MGDSIPIVELAYSKPLSSCSASSSSICNAHALNESFALENFDKGIRTLCYYWLGLVEAL